MLIDKGEAFVFGFSKLDVMFGRQLPTAVHHPYRDIEARRAIPAVHHPGIDPAAVRRDRRWNV